MIRRSLAHRIERRILRLLDNPVVAWTVAVLAVVTWVLLACWSAAGMFAPESCGAVEAVLSPALCAR